MTPRLYKSALAHTTQAELKKESFPAEPLPYCLKRLVKHHSGGFLHRAGTQEVLQELKKNTAVVLKDEAGRQRI